MKRIKVLILMLALLTVLAVVFAAGAVAATERNVELINSYSMIKGTVSNKDGARLYFYRNDTPEDEYYDLKYTYFEPNMDDAVPFGRELIIDTLYSVDSVEYYACHFENNTRTELYMLAEDITPDLSPVTPLQVKTEYDWGAGRLDSPRSYYAVNPEGAYLYAGPSKIYGKVSEKMPENTEITGEYYAGLNEISAGDGSEEIWIYTTYKNVSGWAFISVDPTDHPDFARKAADSDYYGNSDRSRIYFVKDTPIFRDMYSAGDYYFDRETENENLLKNSKTGMVPKNTELTFDYYSYWEGDLTVRINYNGTVGWVNVGQPHMGSFSDTSVQKNDGCKYLKTNKEMAAYSEQENLSGKTDVAIPADYVMECDYAYASNGWAEDNEYQTIHEIMWYRVKYHGSILWITEEEIEWESDVDIIYHLNCYKVVDPEVVEIHTRQDESSEIAGEVKAGDIIYLSNRHKEGWVIIQFNDGQYGWIYSTEEMHSGLEGQDFDDGLYDFELPLDFLNNEEPEEITEEEATGETDITLISNRDSKEGKKIPVPVIVAVAAVLVGVLCAAAVIAGRKKKNQ